MRLRSLRNSTFFLIGIGGLLTLMAFTWNQVLSMTSLLYKMFSEDLLLLVIGIYLVVFMCLLVIRYLAMILFSFLEYIAHGQMVSSMNEQPPPPDDTLPLISLIVPAYNEAMVIQVALRNLLHLDYPHYEVLLVDDGSTDDTYELATEVARESREVTLRVIRKRNGGKSDALNTGIALARGEFVLCMDGDTKLAPGTLRAMIRHFDDPRVGAVAGNVKVINRENIITNAQALEYVEGLAMARRAQSYVRAVNIIPGPCGMFRKTVIRGVGGYDHDTYAEDCDLTLKILLDGWHIAYEPDAVGLVETPSRLLDLIKQRYRWTRGILQAIRKHRFALWHPRQTGAVSTILMWYMLFEGILWPISNVLGNVFFCYVGLQYGVVNFVLFWWLQLTLLDLVAAAYCVVVEKEAPSLIPYAIVFRLFYILIVDVAKVFATIEEWIGSEMSWGKLEREGKLT